ncbi:serine hydrolase [Chitinophaga sp. MM2321]|uniref:serine hydrolase n=1 Tax=Chitinophaga sp. MM2321 TaxID=3137178 RepID=UPI0032D569D9
MQTQHYPVTDNFLTALLKSHKARLGKVFSDPAGYRLQIIYTRIDRDARQQPHFTDFHFGVNPDNYFYPASTVKLPGALLALEKLHDLQLAGVHRNTTMLTSPLPGINPGVLHDYSAAGKLPSISHYIKKIFLVSDNDAFNRLYEFIGQETFNQRLWEMGYTSAQIRHRVGIPLHMEANMHTNAVRFKEGNHLLYEQPAAISSLQFAPRHDLVGSIHYNHLGELEHTPMNFSHRNKLPLTDLHDMLKSIIFPAAVTKDHGFRLTDNDYNFLYHCMSQYPGESIDPVYDTTQFFQAYAKFLLFGGQKTHQVPDHIRVFNKTGWAYGFLTDTAYVTDFASNTEFLLSASIFVNKDGILGDDHQAFEETGKPFLKALGEVIYEEERKREKLYPADLTRFKLDYKQQFL